MWARVKGKTENALLRLPFKAAYMFRPAVVIPIHGVKSKTKLVQLIYGLLRPFYPLLNRSRYVMTSEQLGKAMIRAAIDGYSKSIIEKNELKTLA